MMCLPWSCDVDTSLCESKQISNMHIFSYNLLRWKLLNFTFSTST